MIRGVRGAPHRAIAAIGLLLAAALTLPVAAQSSAGGGAAQAGKAAEASAGNDAAHVNKDIERHRAIAAAHSAAAECLEAGRTEKECHAALRTACQGIAVGRYCGMRHSH